MIAETPSPAVAATIEVLERLFRGYAGGLSIRVAVPHRRA
jgi:hypothetical protein